ncbi:MAG: fatty acid desaturase [Bacteroidota bacterium]
MLWIVHGWSLLEFSSVDFSSPVFYVRFFFQMYLSTGLFITAHDAMHRSISRRKNINIFIGTLACFLFAGMSFKKLLKNHIDHHIHPGTHEDPDFTTHSQNFFVWFGTFMVRYTTILQLVVMGVLYNLLKIRYSELSLWIFWIAPLLLATVQLFYFGTYLPHRLPHSNTMKPHNARTLKKNHFKAMASCYFFGYHLEHHASPSTPWWKLYQIKNSFEESASSGKVHEH